MLRILLHAAILRIRNPHPKEAARVVVWALDCLND